MASLLERALADEGHVVDVARDGTEALYLAGETAYDAILLDVMIPAPDGYEVARRLRRDGCWVPVLMLTARDDIRDRVLGLDIGADDYLTKPFSLDELFARVRSLVRRAPRERPAVLQVGDLRLDPAARTVARDGVPVELTSREFALLTELMRAPGTVLTRTELLERVWDAAEDSTSNVVDSCVRHLREKVDRPFSRQSIQTVRGAGYRVCHG